MAVVNPPFALQGADAAPVIQHPALLFRRALGGLIQQEGVANINGNNDLRVVQTGAGAMSVTVNKGGAYIKADEGGGATTSTPEGGYYYAYNDGDVVLTIAAASTSNPRIDLVVAQIRDKKDGTAVTGDDWTLAVVTGTPAGSPTAPATPLTAIVLAQVAVAANATSILTANITDRRVKVTALNRFIGARAHHTAGTSINDGVETLVTFGGETTDSDAFHDVSTNPSRFTIPTDGIYSLAAQISLPADPDGRRTLSFRKGAAGVAGAGTLLAQVNVPPPPTNTVIIQAVCPTVPLVAGDHVELFITHTSGAAQVLNTGDSATWFSIKRDGVL
jgi:hypothetical protein